MEVISRAKKSAQPLDHSRYLMQVNGCDETLDVAEMHFAETEIAPVPEARKGLISRIETYPA